jgi:Tol biopolymer transport system component
MGPFDLQTGGSDIWVFDLGRGVRSRFTYDAALELGPLWAPDGRSILFASNRSGPWDIYERRLDDTGTSSGGERPVVVSSTDQHPQSLSPDGKVLVFTRRLPQTNQDLWVKTADGREAPYLQTPFDEREAQLSPDGRWMAYASNESGGWEVYVRAFPATTARWKVSIDGGAEPRWRSDGGELFYVARIAGSCL